MTNKTTSTKFHFPTEEAAWQFILNMSGKQTILDYGVDEHRLVNRFFVEMED